MKLRLLSGAGAAVATVLALALLLPSGARALETVSVSAFRLQASNGYEFIATAGVPNEGEEGFVGIYLLGPGGRAGVTYAAPATVTRSRIEADLGALGRISVRRVPTGETEIVRECERGTKKQIPAARFEGTIEFHGEEGFAEVNATGAPAWQLPACGSEEGGGPAGKSLPGGARLDVEKRQLEKYRVEFDAIQTRPSARTRVGVEVEEHRGEIEIHRAVGTWAKPGALTYDSRLRTATVRPPAPFAGHASFDAGASGSNRWTGNLTVDLPGRADVPVTGPGFLATLERPRR